MKKLVTIVLACAAFTAMSASAATFSLLGGSGDTLNADFTPRGSGLSAGDSVTVFNAADGIGVWLDSDSPLKYTFLGKEAGNVNSAFNLNGLLFNSSSSIGDMMTADGTAGWLDFSFETAGPYSPNGTYTNGSAGTAGLLTLAVFGNTGDSSLILLFGDGAGDNDWDDFMVRVSAVPLPAAFWLFGSGLVGLFGMRKRAKKA